MARQEPSTPPFPFPPLPLPPNQLITPLHAIPRNRPGCRDVEMSPGRIATHDSVSISFHPTHRTAPHSKVPFKWSLLDVKLIPVRRRKRKVLYLPPTAGPISHPNSALWTGTESRTYGKKRHSRKGKVRVRMHYIC